MQTHADKSYFNKLLEVRGPVGGGVQIKCLPERFVVGDQDGAAGYRVGGDHDIHVAKGDAGGLELCTQYAICLGLIPAPGQDADAGEKAVHEQLEGGGLGPLRQAVPDFSLGDGGDTGNLVLVQPSNRARAAADRPRAI